MGIAPYKYFTFDGESSRNYDVYLTGEGVFNAPERAVNMIEIPGRNGNYALDQGKFNNITVTYKAGIVDASESNFADKMSAVRNWLCSKVGYKRLEDDYNPNEFRMAVFKSGVKVDHEDLSTGEFDIVFECKPQRWLTSGETATAVANNGTLSNPTLFESEPLLAVKGYGTIDFNGYEVVVNNAYVGDVVVIDDNVPQRDIYVGKHPTYVIDTSMLNNGDTVTVNIDMYCTVAADSATKTGIGTKASQPSPTDSNSAFHSTQNRNKTNTHGTFSFPLGTNYSITNTVTGTTNWVHSNPAVDFTISYSYTQAITYDSATDKIQIVFTLSATSSDANITPVTTGADSKVVTKVYATGYSTKSGLGDPTYIDCEIGECYMIEDGQIVTLNDTVILGSDLPKLSFGTNTFTYDNTVTELKVTPRYWKV